MTSWRRPPTFMPCTPWSQPEMTWPAGTSKSGKSISGLSMMSSRRGMGRSTIVEHRAVPAGEEGSGPVDVLVELVALELQLVDVVLDHVADADDPDQPALVDDRHVPDPALGHHLHQLVDVGVLVARLHDCGHDRRHRVVDD